MIFRFLFALNFQGCNVMSLRQLTNEEDPIHPSLEGCDHDLCHEAGGKLRRQRVEDFEVGNFDQTFLSNGWVND